MRRTELKKIQKRNTSKFASENDEGYCWYECLDGDEVITFNQNDTLALNLNAWKEDHAWHNSYAINKTPITLEEALQFATIETSPVEDGGIWLDFQFVIRFKKKITTDEFIPVIFTLVNSEMNKFNVAPRQHWVEGVNKLNPNTNIGGTYWYNCHFGT